MEMYGRVIESLSARVYLWTIIVNLFVWLKSWKVPAGILALGPTRVDVSPIGLLSIYGA